MRRLLATFIMALFVLAMTAETLKVGGLTRSYITYVPRNLGAHRPLLISSMA